MFPEFTSEASLAIFKIHYCNGEHTNCERFKRASTGTPPPSRMLPDGTMMRELAKKAADK